MGIIAFIRNYIWHCFGVDECDHSNTVLSNNRLNINCSSCFGNTHDEEKEEDTSDSESCSTHTIYEGRVLRPDTSRSVWWQSPPAKEIFTYASE